MMQQYRLFCYCMAPTEHEELYKNLFQTSVDFMHRFFDGFKLECKFICGDRFVGITNAAEKVFGCGRLLCWPHIRLFALSQNRAKIKYSKHFDDLQADIADIHLCRSHAQAMAFAQSVMCKWRRMDEDDVVHYVLECVVFNLQNLQLFFFYLTFLLLIFCLGHLV